jgi:hypothetical protein
LHWEALRLGWFRFFWGLQHGFTVLIALHGLGIGRLCLAGRRGAEPKKEERSPKKISEPDGEKLGACINILLVREIRKRAPLKARLYEQEKLS